MIKVLFVTGIFKNYRIPIMNLIGAQENIELTVVHSGKIISKNKFSFRELSIKEKRIGPFTFHDKSFFDFCEKFDVVVSMLYLQKISLFRLCLISIKKFKLVYWGIGVRASQKHKFDSPTLLNYLRYFMVYRSDASIFYTDYAKKKYENFGIKKEKLFVMNNTVQVNSHFSKDVKPDSIVFIGTLNKSKRIFKLLEAYKRALVNHTLPDLKIIGEGEDYNMVLKWVKENNIMHKVHIMGAIFDKKEVQKVFKKALACISPGQAGLSVLQAFGYSTPFITKSDSYTGGERLNIINNYNGILFENFEELEDIIINISSRREKFIKMGENAKKYYDEHRTPRQMAMGFINAVNYTINTHTK